MRLFLISVIFFGVMISGCQLEHENTEPELTEAQLQAFEAQHDFFETMRSFCGRTLSGETVYPVEDGHQLTGTQLQLEFSGCDENELRIPFKIGDDQTRTLILIYSENEPLLLKHDHRSEDGSPAEYTMYGGYASESGTPVTQYFHADSETTEMLPQAAGNIWTLTVDTLENSLIYELERNENRRFRGKFLLER